MGRACSVCAHEAAFEINEAIVIARESNRTIAQHYGLHYSAVQRHRQHIPQLLLKSAEAQQIADADDLLADIARSRAAAFELLDRAERAARMGGDGRGHPGVSRERPHSWRATGKA